MLKMSRRSHKELTNDFSTSPEGRVSLYLFVGGIRFSTASAEEGSCKNQSGYMASSGVVGARHTPPDVTFGTFVPMLSYFCSHGDAEIKHSCRCTFFFFLQLVILDPNKTGRILRQYS